MGAARRWRGVFATSLLWALAWTPIGAAFAFDEWAALGAHLSMDWSWPPLGFLAPRVGAWTIWGAATGVVFATVLLTRARSRTLEQLSLPRTALWGALAALGLPATLVGGLVVEDGFRNLTLYHALPMLGLAAAWGGGLAAGTLVLAQRGTTDVTREDPKSSINEATT